jgi:hypothetical protein
MNEMGRDGVDTVVPEWAGSLTAELGDRLAGDMEMDALEDHEARWKSVLAEAFRSDATGAGARMLAEFQKRTGLLRKYKSYGIKAAAPLGYAVFLQRPGMGFSFQCHSVRKVEAFHILDVAEGARVFLCPKATWDGIYDEAAFAAWLAGAPDRRYDEWAVVPHPGDVYLIDDRHTVHSVLGCVLEEYASVSVDVVERLHDQNRGLRVPAEFDRAYVLNAIGQIGFPASHQRVRIERGERVASPIAFHEVAARAVLVELPELTATLWRLDAAAVSAPSTCPAEYATQLFVHSGAGWLDLRGSDEADFAAAHAIPFTRGDTLMCAPGSTWRLRSAPGSEAILAEHTVRWGPAVTNSDA